MYSIAKQRKGSEVDFFGCIWLVKYVHARSARRHSLSSQG